MRVVTGSLLLVVVGLVACGDDDGPPGTFRCTGDDGCDDEIACTVDTCGVDGTCNHTGVDERCESGEQCDSARGCVGMCTRNEDCDDSVACTLDTCAVGGVCQATPLNERCPSGQTCNATTGCGTGMMPDAGAGNCTSSAQCDDRIDCTLDSCGADMRCQHIGQSTRCAMGQMCNPSSGCSMQCEGPEECQDGVLCNGVETCDPEFGCAPAELAEDCEDGDPCTINARCDTASDACVYECNEADASCADEPICMEPPMGMFPATYDLVPSIADMCMRIFFTPPTPYFAISNVTFDVPGGILSATFGPMPRASCVAFAQSPVPSDGSFDVECEVSGGCVEAFRFTGRFTDADHLTATFSATYTSTPGDPGGGCGEELFGVKFCEDMTVSVTGTRRP